MTWLAVLLIANVTAAAGPVGGSRDGSPGAKSCCAREPSVEQNNGESGKIWNGGAIALRRSEADDDVEGKPKAKSNRGGGVITSLAGSLDPLRDHFNANKARPRFIALLSPT